MTLLTGVRIRDKLRGCKVSSRTAVTLSVDSQWLVCVRPACSVDLSQLTHESYAYIETASNWHWLRFAFCLSILCHKLIRSSIEMLLTFEQNINALL